ncbi:hypothetical protein [Burkholderia stagnalis]|uniref:hypothetical protein n=1 Tax=Burkholderia stagnalis TaxID=1503054 RepID=UPI000F5FE3B1|nr:hypothetical protein [Burkholderia stagnalis]
MIRLGMRHTGARRAIAVPIAAIALNVGSCWADELGPSCKQYLQLKQQCLLARASTIEANGHAQSAQDMRRSVPFEMHRAIGILAKDKEFMSTDRIERHCAEDAWSIKNAESPQNYRPERSVQLCSVITSWPKNYRITPNYDPKVEARIRKMESDLELSR